MRDEDRNEQTDDGRSGASFLVIGPSGYLAAA